MISLNVVKAALVFSAMPAAAAELTVAVTGAAPAEGQILATLFDSAQGWMQTPAQEVMAPVDRSGTAEVTFSELVSGDYGVSIVHDENENGELDSNLIGIPTEAFGFSNDASALFGPPAWVKTAFAVNGDTTHIIIHLGRVN